MLWCEPGHILRSRSRGLEPETVTLFPELRRIARELGAVEALLDGEIVALGDDGVPDAKRLRDRKRAGSEAVAKRLSRSAPATIVLFDLLFCDGHDLTDQPYVARREALEGLGLDGGAWQTPAYHRGDGAALLEAAAGRGLAGVVAKRLRSPYRAGRRGRDWIKVEA